MRAMLLSNYADIHSPPLQMTECADPVPALGEVLVRVRCCGICRTDLHAIPSLDYDKTIFYERNIRSVTANTREDGRNLLVEAAAAKVRAHITCYPLAEANAALQDLEDDRINGTGVLFVS